MDTTNRTQTTTTIPLVEEKPTGLEDVVRSVRAIARTARNLGEASANVVEREMAMALSISNRLRDDVISQETLDEARKAELPGKLRQDAHEFVNLLADFGSVLFLTATRFIEDFADERRPPIDNSTTSTSGGPAPQVIIITETK